MTTEQTNNAKLIVDSLNKYGITNQYLQAAILATVSKESNFVPKSENLNYSYENIKRVWPKTSDADAKRLANNPVALGDFKYGGRGGNAANEGYKYRGRGFNQITFKDNYRADGNKIGVDLVSNPDLLNTPKVASDALAVFYKDGLNTGDKIGTFNKFGVTDSAKVDSLDKATKVAIQINGGLGTNFNNNILQEGYGKASSVVESLYSLVTTATTTATTEAKKKPALTILVLGAMVGALILIIKTVKQNGK